MRNTIRVLVDLAITELAPTGISAEINDRGFPRVPISPYQIAEIVAH
jgi:hypothetical protein